MQLQTWKGASEGASKRENLSPERRSQNRENHKNIEARANTLKGTSLKQRDSGPTGEGRERSTSSKPNQGRRLIRIDVRAPPPTRNCVLKGVSSRR